MKDKLSDHIVKGRECVDCKCTIFGNEMWYAFEKRGKVIVSVPICDNCSELRSKQMSKEVIADKEAE